MAVIQTQLDFGIESGDGGNPVDVPDLTAVGESKGVVFTKPWVVNLILDLAGYRADLDLASLYAVEPSAGEGAFLLPMIRRLLDSMEAHGRTISEAAGALHAYELEGTTAERMKVAAVRELCERGASAAEARNIATSWLTVGDYLLESPSDRRADFVVGNPPYIRYDDLGPGMFSSYQRLYPTMIGRCDIYVGFIEAGLHQLSDGGVLAFICADRWMRSAYGGDLRALVTRRFGVEVVIEMHDAPAFENDVAAYPAVIVIRKAPQGVALVATADSTSGRPQKEGSLANAVVELSRGRGKRIEGFTASRLDRWFDGGGPWPSLEPERLKVLQTLEDRHRTLEDLTTGTKVGIGVATGADKVFVTTDPSLVEPDRLLPLAMSADTKSGHLHWSGHYLVNPWAKSGGLADLDAYPRLGAYFEANRDHLIRRNIAKRQSSNWYRTIDRVHYGLTSEQKLYFPDMKLTSNPVLDRGETYPHHNLYFVRSTVWDLEVLGGLLMSKVAELFIEAYCVKMRGGTLRFQAQYLRRVRVPDPGSLSVELSERLRAAFLLRDFEGANQAAAEAYGIADRMEAIAC